MSPESLAGSVATSDIHEDHQTSMLPSSSVVVADDVVSAAYVIPTLALGDGTFVFTYLGNFLSHITPHDLPVRKYHHIYMPS